MEATKVLQALVAPVATLGELAATVSGPERGERWAVSRAFLRGALREFTWWVRYTLERRDITNLGRGDVPPKAQGNVPSLSQALATLGATPGDTWAEVRARAEAWQEALDLLAENWHRLQEEVWDICYDWKGNARAIAKAIAKATKGTKGTKAISRAAKAIVKARRGPQEGMALRLLDRLADECEEAYWCFDNLLYPLIGIVSVLERRKELPPPDVREFWMAEAAERERLWEASARLATRHLLGTLGDIHELLVSPLSGRGGPDGPGGRAVAERCQRALEDIPGLLGGDSDVTAGTSSGQ